MVDALAAAPVPKRRHRFLREIGINNPSLILRNLRPVRVLISLRAPFPTWAARVEDPELLGPP